MKVINAEYSLNYYMVNVLSNGVKFMSNSRCTRTSLPIPARFQQFGGRGLVLE